MSETEQAVRLEPCRFCGRSAKIEAFQIDDDPQWWYVATCVVCPVKTCDQFTAEEAARIWNTRASDVALQPSGEWRHVHIPAGNQRVVAIEFETAEEATEFINKFATAPVTAPVSTGEPDAHERWFKLLAEAISTATPVDTRLNSYVISREALEGLSVAHREIAKLLYGPATSTTPDGERERQDAVRLAEAVMGVFGNEVAERVAVTEAGELPLEDLERDHYRDHPPDGGEP